MIRPGFIYSQVGLFTILLRYLFDTSLELLVLQLLLLKQSGELSLSMDDAFELRLQLLELGCVAGQLETHLGHFLLSLLLLVPPLLLLLKQLVKLLTKHFNLQGCFLNTSL